MNRTMNRVLTLVVFLNFLLLTAACGGPPKKENEPTTPATSSTTTTPTPDASAMASDAGAATTTAAAAGDGGAASGAKQFPESVAEADKLRTGGASWTNVEIREHYLKLIDRIHTNDEQLKKDGKKAEERGKKAYQSRHDARMTCRAMMSDRKEVEGLQARDKEKYGQGDGPTFEQLVDHEKKKNLKGDAIYEAIIASSQRTDGAVNEMLGVAPPPKK